MFRYLEANLSGEEQLARVEVLKLMVDPTRTWRLARDENGRLMVLSALGTVILQAPTWSEMLALITVHPTL